MYFQLCLWLVCVGVAWPGGHGWTSRIMTASRRQQGSATVLRHPQPSSTTLWMGKKTGTTTEDSPSMQAALDFQKEEDVKLWLQGCTLLTRFQAFESDEMVMIKLKNDQNAVFEGSITSYEPAPYRITRPSDSSSPYQYLLEVMHVVHPDVFAFFDLDEKYINGKGVLDMQTKTISQGQITTNKKRFGLLPYVDELGTFETVEIFDKDTPIPADKIVHDISHIPLNPPEGFNTPADMVKFPQYFDPEFVEWWFSVEDAMSRGEEPPPRPNKRFNPNPNATPQDPKGITTNQKLRQLKLQEEEMKSRRSLNSNKKKTGFQK